MAARTQSDVPNRDLALLSLQAAIQLSRLLKQQDADHRTISAFLTELTSTPGLGSTWDPKHLAANPEKITLLNRALGDAEHKDIDRMDEFLTRLSSLIKNLSSPDDPTRRTAQEHMKAFCLSLHNKILADRFPPKDADAIFADGVRRVGLH